MTAGWGRKLGTVNAEYATLTCVKTFISAAWLPFQADREDPKPAPAARYDRRSTER
jgi:hypothetical protein